VYLHKITEGRPICKEGHATNFIHKKIAKLRWIKNSFYSRYRRHLAGHFVLLSRSVILLTTPIKLATGVIGNKNLNQSHLQTVFMLLLSFSQLALSNAVSKLTSFPTPASHFPHLAIRQRLWLEFAWICALYKFCSNNNDDATVTIELLTSITYNLDTISQPLTSLHRFTSVILCYHVIYIFICLRWCFIQYCQLSSAVCICHTLILGYNHHPGQLSLASLHGW